VMFLHQLQQPVVALEGIYHLNSLPFTQCA
jgi:hypothetical protein